MMRAVLAAVVYAAAAAIVAPTATAALHDTVLVSRANGPLGARAGGNDNVGRVSANGRFVAFASYVATLESGVPTPPQFSNRVYVRDLVANTTRLVSRADGTAGVAGDRESHVPTISADGRYVAFRSSATNLASGDTSGDDDIYRRDTIAGRTVLVSRATGVTGPKADGSSLQANISADGRYVSFTCFATNLGAGPDSKLRAYVRDVVAGTTVVASRAAGTSGAAVSAGDTAISADGRLVAFTSEERATPDDTDDDQDVFVRDLQRQTTTLVSVPGGPLAAGRASQPTISASGARIAFTWSKSDASGFGSGVYLRDLAAKSTTLVSAADNVVPPRHPSSQSPAVSPDGRFVAFDSRDFLTNDGSRDLTQDVFVRDVAKRRTYLVSRASGASGAKGNDLSFLPSIAADGRVVSFTSIASNLSPADGAGDWDVYAHYFAPASAPPVTEPPIAAEDVTRPVVSRLRVVPARLHPGRRARAHLIFRLSEAARTHYSVDRVLRGRWRAGRCQVRRTGPGRPCRIYRPLPGTITFKRQAGVSRVTFKRRIGGRGLAPGRYRMTLTATDAAGNRSVPRRANFAIKTSGVK